MSNKVDEYKDAVAKSNFHKKCTCDCNNKWPIFVWIQNPGSYIWNYNALLAWVDPGTYMGNYSTLIYYVN